MDDPREKKLRLAIKEMAIASSGKVLRGGTMPCFVHVLHERKSKRELLEQKLHKAVELARKRLEVKPA